MKRIHQNFRKLNLTIWVSAIVVASSHQAIAVNISGDTVTSNLTVNGTGWFQGNNIWAGAGKELKISWAPQTDVNFGYAYMDITRPSGRFYWRDNTGNSSTNKMILDTSNVLTLYKNSAVTAGITLTPESGRIDIKGTAGGGLYSNGVPLVALNTSGVGSLTVAGDSYINSVRIGIGQGGIVSNAVFGAGALNTNVSGANNSAFGTNSLAFNTSGSFNSAFGGAALMANNTGVCNVAIGVNALTFNTSGGYNVGVGTTAGAYLLDGTTPLTSPTNSIFIGANSRGSSYNDVNTIVIGVNTSSRGANTTVIGTSTTTQTYLAGQTVANSLSVIGATVLSGQVTLAAPQGDISMGIFGN